MTALTTHVLNTSNGKPASNLHIELIFYQGTKKINCGKFITNADGRIDQPLLSGKDFKLGTYDIIFHVRDYLLEKCPFLKNVENTRWSWIQSCFPEKIL